MREGEIGALVPALRGPDTAHNVIARNFKKRMSGAAKKLDEVMFN